MENSFFANAEPQAVRTLMRISGADLQSRMGAGALKKAQDVSDQGNVRDIEWIKPTLLSGRVRLAGIAPRTQVRFGDGTFTTQCACLLAGECEHAAALILAAQALIDAEENYAQPWDEALDEIIGYVETAGELLALHVEYSPTAADIWLTPMRPGTHRPWVTKLAGWTALISLQWGSVTDTFNTAQLGILREIYRISRENTTWRSPGEVTVSSLGEQAFSLLRRAQESGITLLADIHTWEHVRLQPHNQQIFLKEEITADGISLHPVQGQEASATGTVRKAETRIATIDVLDGGTLLRENSSSTETDPFLAHGTLHVPASDIARYLSEYAPQLRARYPHQPENQHHGKQRENPGNEATLTSENTGAVLETMTLLGRLEPRHNGRNVRVSWWAKYEHMGHISLARLSGGQRQHQRNLHNHSGLLKRWEELNAQILSRHLPAQLWPHLHDSWTLHHWDFPAYLLPLFEAEIIDSITLEGLQWDLSALDDAITVNDAPMQISTKIRASAGNVDWFDLSATIRVGGIEIPLPEALRAIAVGEEHLFTQGQWVRLDSERVESLREALEQAGAISPEQRHPQLSLWHAHMWKRLQDLSDETRADEEWAARIARLPISGELPPLPLVESENARLRPYQMDGHHWLTSLMQAQLGGILADDMGLGKTLQMLSAVASLKNYFARLGQTTPPILVIAPTSVTSTWVHEAQRWYPHLRVHAVKTTSKIRSESIADIAQHCDMVVATYSVVRLDVEEFSQVKWAGCILDEAHIAKNPRTAIYRAIRSLDRQWTIALTGTPVENSWADLWALTSLTSPGLLPSWQRFRERFVTPIDKLGDQRMLTMLREAIAPFMLRRSKESVATDLPQKTETVLSVPLDKSARLFYERLLNQERARILGLLATGQRQHVEVLSAMTRLRQAAIDPALVDEAFAVQEGAKTQALVEVLSQIVPAGHQSLVFSQFTSYLDRIGAALDEAGISFVRLDGATRDRDRVIERFQAGEARVFLISLKAGGTGLTLTEADYVFVMDPWWNPAAEAQAVDRAHRIGQTKPVTVYRLVSEGTIEEKVVELQEKKRALVDMLVVEDAGTLGRISVEDIRALLA